MRIGRFRVEEGRQRGADDDKKEIKERALKLMIMITITTQTLSPSPYLSPMCEFDSLSLPG